MLRPMRIGAFEVNEIVCELREQIAVGTLRPWLDAGNVGTLAMRALRDALDARDIGELATPGEFFDFTRYRPNVRYRGDEREFVVPNTRLSSARLPEGPDILLLDVLEPHARAEEYMDSMVEVLAVAGVRSHWRLGAWFGGVPHSRPLRVSMTTGSRQLDAKTGRETRRTTRYEGPTSIMSLLTHRLEAREIENNSLMIQLPHYAQIDEDYSAAAAMLEAAGDAFGVSSALSEVVEQMRARGARQYEQLGRMVAASPDLVRAVESFEKIYDAEHGEPGTGGSGLSPEIERFLGEVARRIDEDQEPTG